jgi:predicted adenylyl cyclase CyaB
MAREIELKFRVDDPGEMRERLVAAGARFASLAFEVNRIFDTRKRKLRAKACGLRVRTSTFGDERPPEARLTFKGPRGPGEFKSREELEVVTTDAQTLIKILARLGYHEVIHYEKRRETWTLDDCEVVLDELPRMGWWLEIEAVSEQAVTDVRERLSLTETPPADKTYVAMAAKEGRDDDGCSRLVFKP